jgi:hypothetical protein
MNIILPLPPSELKDWYRTESQRPGGESPVFSVHDGVAREPQKYELPRCYLPARMQVILVPEDKCICIMAEQR